MKFRQTLPKNERLYGRKLTTEFFRGGASKSMVAFPLRMVYQAKDADPCRVLVSVPKRLLHRANKRNRVKRQIREAYRKHKDIIAGTGLMVAFLWLDDKLYTSEEVEKRVVNLLTRAVEKINSQKEAVDK